MIGADKLARTLASWRTHGPAYRALANTLRLHVLDGRLPLRTRLPSERELAVALGVSRTTVTAAYATLREEGYLASRRASGSWTALPAGTAGVAGINPLPDPGNGQLDLSHAAPTAPVTELPAAARAAAEALPAHLAGHGYELAGLPALRAAVAARYAARGLPTDPDQVVVTSGALHAWALLLRLLAGPGDRVLVEGPTYPNALVAIARAGARPVPVPFAEDGWDIEMLAATLRQAAPRLAYLTPDHQNPTGYVMDGPTRAAVAGLAARTRTALVVDETLAELGLAGGPPPTPLASHHPDAVTIGSLSKSHWGGLRIGWIRAPRALVDRLVAVRASLDLGTPVLEQLIATLLLDGTVGDSLPERRAVLLAQRDTLAAAIRDRLPDWRFRLPAGGLSLWIDLGAPVSSALTVAAGQHGIRLAAGPLFGVEGAFERYLRLPYTLPADRLTEAVTRLAAAWPAVSAGRTVTSATQAL
jgi:DNA-binding transcriptional MocR family regulator